MNGEEEKGTKKSWRDGDGRIGTEDIICFLSQVVRGRIGGKKPATVTERIRAATVLLKLYQDGEILSDDEEEDTLSRAMREFEEERQRILSPCAEFGGYGPGYGSGCGPDNTDSPGAGI